MQNLSMCRICLATDIRLCSVARSLQDMYEKLTELTFKREDRRPLAACYICHARLQNCYRLRMSCLRSDKLITKMMSSGVLVPQDMSKRNTLSVVPVLNLSLGHMLRNRMECHIKEEEEALEVIHDAELDQQNTEVLDAEDLKFEIEDTVIEENDAKLLSQSVDNMFTKIKKSKRSLEDPRPDIPAFKKLKHKDSQLDTDPEDYISNKNNTDAAEGHSSHMPTPAFSSYSECVSGRSKPLASSEAFQRSRRIPNDDGEESAPNYGSEASSGESDDEEEMAVPLLPRSLRSVLDTPVDEEDCDDDDDDPAAAELTEAEVTGTELPGSFLDFNWETFPRAAIPPESRRESFSQNKVGPTTPCVDPYAIFTAIWDKQIMEHIALETNKYAQQVAAQLFESNNLHPNSRITRWKDTTVDELYVYFGVVMAMGIVVKSRLQEYWNSTADIFITPGFTAHFSFNRFTLLTKCLHFNDNNKMSALNLDVSEAKLFKIMPILTHLNSKFQDMYKLSQNISLDESLLMRKGCINQLVPNKAPVMGLKTYELCESHTGYLWRFEIHSHKKSPPQKPKDILNASTPALVLRLLHGLENMGHTVWMDDFYNSPALARRLKYLGFDCAGTLRTNRKFVPQALHDLTKDNMRPGELSGLTSGDVDVMVWKNSNRVAMISTYHGNNVSHYEGSTKPIVILDYNIMMGGVDKKDQMLTIYPIERQRMSVWYKKLFRRLLNVSILNSFIIHKHSSSPSFPLTHRNFRISLVKALFTNHCTRTPSISLPASQNLREGNTQRFMIDPQIHHISYYKIRPRQKQRTRRQCPVCKAKVSSFCVGCDKPVCPEPCFVSLHRP